MELANPLFWLIALFLAVLSIVAIKIGFNFDINKYLETRRERQKEKLRILCPHAQISKKDGVTIVVPLLISPPGTSQWICERCSTTAHGPDLINRAMEAYRKNPDLLKRNENRFHKFAEKFYKL